MQLSKELDVQYRTAWHMLHSVREACSGLDFTLSNVCEVDTIYRMEALVSRIGGKRLCYSGLVS